MRAGPVRFLVRLWRLALVGLLASLALKWGVVDGYEVRGSSMAPLLMDGPDAADKVAVVKHYFDLVEPERFDLVVFHAPPGEDRRLGEDGNGPGGPLLVKRVVAFAGERVLVRDGDLFVGPVGEPLPARPVVRPVERILAMLQPVAELPLDGGRLPPLFEGWGDVVSEPGRLRLSARPGDPPARLVFRGWITDMGPVPAGEAPSGAHRVNDTALLVRYRLRGPDASLSLWLREQGDAFGVRLPASGSAEVEVDAGPRRAVVARVELPPSSGGEREVLFLNVDDRLLLRVDGAWLLDRSYEGNTEVLGLGGRSDPELRLEAGEAQVTALSLLRDVYYTEEGALFAADAPCPVPEGRVFVLGDNSANSRDSRHFGPVARGSFVGRPVLIFHPWRRFRWLR